MNRCHIKWRPSGNFKVQQIYHKPKLANENKQMNERRIVALFGKSNKPIPLISTDSRDAIPAGSVVYQSANGFSFAWQDSIEGIYRNSKYSSLARARRLNLLKWTFRENVSICFARKLQLRGPSFATEADKSGVTYAEDLIRWSNRHRACHVFL